MENYKNMREDKRFFPYEYGASRYSQTSDAILQLSVREELASNIDLIYTLKSTFILRIQRIGATSYPDE